MTLLAFGLRAYLLPDKAVWYDEAISAWTARLPLADIALYQARAVHPPLHYWLLHLWGGLAGESEYALRFLSLAFGVMTVPLLYQIGRRFLGPGVGLTASLLLAVSAFHISWSQQVRMYSLATFLGALSVYLLLRIVCRESVGADPRVGPGPRGGAVKQGAHTGAPLPASSPLPSPRGRGSGRRVGARHASPLLPEVENAAPLQWALDCPHLKAWAAYAAVNALALYTLYLTGIVLMLEAAMVLLVALAGRRLRLLLGWGASAAATLVAWLPWLYLMKTNAGTRSPIAPPYEFSLIWRIYYTILSVGVDINIDRYAVAVLPFLALAAFWLFGVWRDPRRRAMAWLLSLVLVVPPALVYVMSLPKTMFYTPAVHARYFILFLPLYLLLLAWSLAMLGRSFPRRWGLPLAGAIGALLVGITVYALVTDYYAGRYLDDDWQSIAATVRAHRMSEDAVLLYPDQDWPIFLYHYRGRALYQYSDRPEADLLADPPWYGVPYATKVTAEGADHLLSPIAASKSALWVVESVKALDVDPEGQIGAWLRANYRIVGKQAFGDKTLILYSRAGGRDYGWPLAPRTQPARPLLVQPVPGLSLLGYDQPLHRAATGAVARVGLYWQAEPGVGERYRIGLRLADGEGDSTAARPAGEAPADWPANAPLRETYEATITSQMPGGRYRWLLEVRERRGDAIVASLPLGDVEVVRTRQPLLESAIPHPLQANLGGEVQLLGYDAAPELGAGVSPGGHLNITLYWRGQQAMERSYTVFVQLVGKKEHPQRHNPVWAQQDSVPGDGTLPTTGWAPGEIVVDHYTLTIEDGTEPGDYAIYVGMYDRATGERLSVLDASGQAVDNKVVLGEIAVR
ncbi:MAG: glycosyltransferase family 39 protein [Chloroflexi bacterium]|nr:glycosyltransferase family 39 protein [Chloroflexota bacterium]